jgi:hypothetical protein
MTPAAWLVLPGLIIDKGLTVRDVAVRITVGKTTLHEALSPGPGSRQLVLKILRQIMFKITGFRIRTYLADVFLDREQARAR